MKIILHKASAVKGLAKINGSADKIILSDEKESLTPLCLINLFDGLIKSPSHPHRRQRVLPQSQRCRYSNV